MKLGAALLGLTMTAVLVAGALCTTHEKLSASPSASVAVNRLPKSLTVSPTVLLRDSLGGVTVGGVFTVMTTSSLSLNAPSLTTRLTRYAPGLLARNVGLAVVALSSVAMAPVGKLVTVQA